MPELPEVETIVRQLKNTVLGKVIEDMGVLDEKYIYRKKNASLQKLLLLKNAPTLKIMKIERSAKAIIITLSQGEYFFIRLGMTGYFSYAQKTEQKKEKRNEQMTEQRKTPHAKITVRFNDGSELTFHDIRKFGSFQLFSRNELLQELKKIGPEPLSEKFTPHLLFQLLQQKKNANLKTTLMDQSVIAGIGNIYAQEALYRAKIDPKRTAGSINLHEVKKLHFYLQSTLQKAIAAGGSTVDNYSHLEGAGSFQQQLAVYQKDFCPKKHSLQRIVLGGRGTWWCKECQK